MAKTIVHIEHIKEMQKQRERINKPLLDDIEFYENGKLLHIDKRLINKFIFTGLSNIDFITSGYYCREIKE